MPLETFTPADVSAMPNCHLSIHPIKLSEYDVIGFTVICLSKEDHLIRVITIQKVLATNIFSKAISCALNLDKDAT